MDDIVSHKMAADYKVYELRNVIRDLKDCRPAQRSRQALLGGYVQECGSLERPSQQHTAVG